MILTETFPLDQIEKETNEGYDNTGIPLQMVPHCVEKTYSVRESSDGSYMLNQFDDVNGIILRTSIYALQLIDLQYICPLQ